DSSAGLDLATSQPILLDTAPKAVPTGVHGPTGDGNHALLLGRSSATMMGLFNLPGVIDTDFTGESKIMMWTPQPPCFVPQGARVAQLILFKNSIHKDNAIVEHRGEKGFGSKGSPGVFWVQKLTEGRPMLWCTMINGEGKIVVNGLIDTGTDVTIIA
ncbi:POK9 protein, partial [Rhynochetos jubatus]|nr:POK9 protein [Rhynochetos jubatus]